eukprot:s2890_g8.t1
MYIAQFADWHSAFEVGWSLSDKNSMLFGEEQHLQLWSTKLHRTSVGLAYLNVFFALATSPSEVIGCKKRSDRLPRVAMERINPRGG